MDANHITIVVCGVIWIILGFLMAFDVPFVTVGLRKRYTDFSIQLYCRKCLSAMVISGAGIILIGFFPEGLWFYFGLLCIVTGIVLSTLYYKVLERRKKQKR